MRVEVLFFNLRNNLTVMIMRKVIFKSVLVLAFLFIKSVAVAQIGFSMWKALDWERKDFTFWHYPKEVRSLVKNCTYCMDEEPLSAKDAKKIAEQYERICKIDAKHKAYADCVYGNFMLRAKGMKEYHKRGIELMESGIRNPEILGKSSTAYFLALLSENCLIANDVQNRENLAFKYIRQAQGLSSYYHEPLGYYYLYGIGTQIDIAKGVDCLDKHIKQLTESGSASRMIAAARLNSLYEQKQAAEIYQKSNGKARELYCEGMKSAILQNQVAAKSLIQQAADLGYEPAMYHHAYLLYMQRKDEKGIMLQLAKGGYLPAAFVVADEKLVGVANATLVAQVKKAQAEAYPLFQRLAEVQYYPAVYLCVDYSNGTLCKTFTGSVFENVVKDVLAAIGPKGNTSNVSQTSARNNGKYSVNSSVKTSSGSKLVDITRVQNKENHYRSMCNHAETWLKKYHDADAWIKVHEGRKMNSSEQFEYKSKLEHRRFAREHLKRVILPDLQLTRRGAADAGGNIPISSVESQISAL